MIPSFNNDEIVDTTIVSDTSILGAGDTHIYKNFISDNEASILYDEIMTNIDFQQWYHMPNKNSEPKPLQRIKRIIVNPDSEGNLPYYRFTVNDQFSHGMLSPMPPFINNICQKINNTLNIDLNHIVILLYRDGNDIIGFHKDKTLDLDENAPIISLSLGCTRTYCLRDNNLKPTIHQEIELSNGTLLVLGPHTNNNFYHAIKPLDNNSNENSNEKSNEKSNIPRISITFRKAITFKKPDNTIIGKGEQYQTLNWPIELKGNHIIGYHQNNINE